jgi:hypothetical protein
MAVLYSPQYYYIAISKLNEKINISNRSEKKQELRDNINKDIITIKASTDRIVNQLKRTDSTINEPGSNEDQIKTHKGMYDDSRNLYITKLLENYLLFISICGVSYGIYKSKRSLTS